MTLATSQNDFREAWLHRLPLNTAALLLKCRMGETGIGLPMLPAVIYIQPPGVYIETSYIFLQLSQNSDGLEAT